MKVALAQVNPLVGDLEGNGNKIAARIGEAREAGARLVVFPELAITGYPPRDFLLKSSFVDANIRAVHQLAGETQDGITALVGFVSRNQDPVGRPLRNSVAILQGGRLVTECHKSLLPTDDVFDELRYFEPAAESPTISLDLGAGPVPVGITICEDLWNDSRNFPRQLYHRSPIEEVRNGGAKLVVNVSASPFWVEKQGFRERLMGEHAQTAGAPLLFVNQVGGNDDILFDGGTAAFDAQGRVVARANPFVEDLLLVDLAETAQQRIAPYPVPLESVRQGLVMGTRDYVQKCGFREVVIGLSGGIDSAVTAAIAVEALGPQRVHGVAMPSRFSSDHSVNDARQLAENLDIDFRLIPIREIHDAFEAELQPHFEGQAVDITEENIQARTRGNILMALSNKFGWLLLSTGNKSELSVGYCTLYGDMCGGLAVISDVPKTMVYDLARHINATAGAEIIPQSSITKPPSAELRPDQHDQQSLPPYEVLDAILQAYIENEKSAAEIVKMGFPEDVVNDITRKVDRNEYKRKQAATGLKVTSRAFGVGRRMPIAARLG